MRGIARSPTVVDAASPVPPDPPEIKRIEPMAEDCTRRPFLELLSGRDPLRVMRAGKDAWREITGAYSWYGSL